MSSPTSRLPEVLVADANVLLSATIGGRARDVLLHRDVPEIVAATAVGDEVLRYLPGIGRKRGLDLGMLLSVFATLPIAWVPSAVCSGSEAEARRRMASRDEDDWPTVALCLHLAASREVAVWTQDKDFTISRLPMMTTGDLLDRLEGRDAP